MEGFEYVDIFATKGMEYLIVIVFLISLIFFWRFLNRPAKAVSQEGRSKRMRTSLLDLFNLADNFYYHQGHSWVIPENHDVVRVGIDDFAQKLLGKPSNFNLPKIGTQIVQGAKGWQIQVNSKLIDVLSPISGEVVAVNEKVLNSPQLINQDPYENGWLIKVKTTSLISNLANLLSGSLARAWIEDAVDKLNERITVDLDSSLGNNEIPIIGLARELSPEKWEQLVGEFLLTAKT